MATARRRRLGPILALLFLVVPILEIYVLIQVGHVIGAGWTVLLLIADAVFGAWLVKREGRRAWTALQQSIGTGRMPTRELSDAGLILIGGTLMISPGFVTDIVGFVLILPFTRPLARRVLSAYLARRVRLIGGPPDGSGAGGGFGPGGFGPPGFAPGSSPNDDPGNGRRPGPGTGPVVQGEVIDR